MRSTARRWRKAPQATARQPKMKRNRSPSWSGRVTRHSNALDLEPRTFSAKEPRKIALSLKRAASQSRRRKAGSYQSAMSMLNFYINRAGRNLPARHKKLLERAKVELRDLYGRTS